PHPGRHHVVDRQGPEEPDHEAGRAEQDEDGDRVLELEVDLDDPLTEEPARPPAPARGAPGFHGPSRVPPARRPSKFLGPIAFNGSAANQEATAPRVAAPSPRAPPRPAGRPCHPAPPPGVPAGGPDGVLPARPPRGHPRSPDPRGGGATRRPARRMARFLPCGRLP